MPVDFALRFTPFHLGSVWLGLCWCKASVLTMTSAAFHLPGPPPARSSGAHRSAGCKPLQSPWGPMAVSRSCLCTRAPSQHNWDQADSGRRVLLPASVHLVRTEGASDSRQALCFYRKSQRECALRFWGLVGPENKQHGSQTRESPLRLSVVCKREFRPQARKPMQLCFSIGRNGNQKWWVRKNIELCSSLFFFFNKQQNFISHSPED